MRDERVHCYPSVNLSGHSFVSWGAQIFYLEKLECFRRPQYLNLSAIEILAVIWQFVDGMLVANEFILDLHQGVAVVALIWHALLPPMALLHAFWMWSRLGPVALGVLPELSVD